MNVVRPEAGWQDPVLTPGSTRQQTGQTKQAVPEGCGKLPFNPVDNQGDKPGHNQPVDNTPIHPQAVPLGTHLSSTAFTQPFVFCSALKIKEFIEFSTDRLCPNSINLFNLFIYFHLYSF
ncbi:hypothetical protein [Pseudomonas abyssi]|uniref:hypothetical protein n=1 Tax=Pseudomonas abyssi TaxID=170540 RepID=UPI0011C1879D|nr:hypothetical protein [Halopseudomonas gallaeciensis]